MSNWHQDDFLREPKEPYRFDPAGIEKVGQFIRDNKAKLNRLFGVVEEAPATGPREVPSFRQYYIDMLPAIAARSKDPRNQVGCLLVGGDGNVLSTGYNGFPAQVEETPERWSRPAKYNYVVHAEANAIAAAAKHGTHTFGSTAYVSFAPCTSCAKLLIAAGIFTVVVDKKNHDRVVTAKWETDGEIVKDMFEESRVNLIWWTGEEK